MRFLKNSPVRHIVYEQKGGYLLLPIFIMLLLSSLAVTLPLLEGNVPAIAHWSRKATWLVPTDPSMAQLLLGAIAGSCITIVSVVYSVLLIALTFASIQFSPRILTSFLKDRVSQGTLGIFIGTFSYCLVLLPSIHGQPKVFVPILSLTVGLILAAVCIFYLIYFIQHIALAIQANYIVDRIARETETVMRSMFGALLDGACPREEEPLIEPMDAVSVASSKSGYIQFIDEQKLLNLAVASGAIIFLFRNVGQFIPAGVPCFSISGQTAVTGELEKQCLACFHIGPLRAMECDVEFGMLQIVDIALKAISPAVNDPSTAIACIDHLSALLLLSSTLEPPITRAHDDAGNVRLIRRQTSFPRLLDIAYNQISPYGKGDMAVSLRLMRALQDISGTTHCPPYLAAIRRHAQRVVKACATCFEAEDCSELFERLTAIEQRSDISLV